ncbi:MAG: Smr/MutS family protein [Treponema sp.]|nr:Smr/MutS family protein [Treponema sp.]
MNTKTLDELAFYTIREDISGWCVSPEGKDALLHRDPLPPADHEAIIELKETGEDWMALMNDAQSAQAARSGTLLEGWQPVRQSLYLASAEGAALDTTQLYDVLTFSRSVLSVRHMVESRSPLLSLKRLPEKTALLPTQAALEAVNAIDRILDKDGQLRDLPALREIRAKIAKIHADIEREIKRYTSDTSLLTNVLEANVPAYRADRQVLAVKASQKSRVHGIVHEVSQSGQTVYIEPEEVVRKNNELVQEEFHLLAETRKICAETTAQIKPLAEDLRQALSIMLFLDTTLAASRWGEAHRAVYALECTGSRDNRGEVLPPLLLQARHPLLGSKAVPIDIRCLPEKRVLIITGPNTGGKTVTLKTFALFAMLNQAGFPVPASDGTRLPLFDNVFADIGDEQSIDQSLSTFSAHMKNIASALDISCGATAESLVLLDELASGTDPQEGGAIAMAVLDALIARGAFVLVTTHHGILKNYGYTNAACINASVDFDAETLKPTYRLRMGIPGESHALDIATHSGLPADVLSQAKSYLVNEQADVSKLINGLVEKHAEADRILLEHKNRERAQNEKQRKLDLLELRLKQNEHEIKEREKRADSRFVAETRRRLENLIRTLREGEITREKTLRAKAFITELGKAEEASEKLLEDEEAALDARKAALEKQARSAAAEKERGVRSDNGILILPGESGRRTAGKSKKKSRASNKEAFAAAKSTYSDALIAQLTPKDARKKEAVPTPVWEPGAEVFAGPSRTRGTLIREERRGVWTVQLGAIRMSVKERDMVLVPTEGSSAPQKASVSIELSSAPDGENAIFMKSSAEARPVFELKLLGMRAEEAVKVLERQLDLCTLQNFKSFSIVHGKGTGVLQQAVQDYLASYPGVAEFHFARPEEGGTGKTYVSMR